MLLFHDKCNCLSTPTATDESILMCSLGEIPLCTKMATAMEENRRAASTQAEEVDPFEECIVMRVVYSNAIVKNQQRDDPELTMEEKISYLVDLLKRKPVVFLNRFGRLLDPGHLTYFDALDEQDVKQKLEELRGRENPGRSTVKNRRYVYMLQLMEKGTYFSEEEMRSRNPLLYEYYIGQYMTQEEKEALRVQSTEVLLSSRLLQRVDRDACDQKLAKQLQEEDAQVEETDSEDDEEEETPDMTSSEMSEKHGIVNIKLSSDPNIARKERRMLQKEFLQAMQLNFLDGKDEAFDYSSVDCNTSLDISNIQDLDDQEAYFDAEEPSLVDTSTNHVKTPLGMINMPSEHATTSTDFLVTPTDHTHKTTSGVSSPQGMVEMEIQTNHANSDLMEN